MPVLKLADSKVAKIGDQVIAMGSSRVLEEPVTYGIISNTHSRVSDENIINAQQRNRDKCFGYIETDTRTCQGNSGGPLINLVYQHFFETLKN